MKTLITIRKIRNLNLAIIVLLLIWFVLLPEQAQAQWPPFAFDLNHAYQDNKITYRIEFREKVEGVMTDLEIKIPLPEGTRFLEAVAIPSIDASFDGQEITFFMSVVNRNVVDGDAVFVLEVTDPAMTIFTTVAWMSWEGDLPGTYLTEDIAVDITKQPLIWEEPAEPRLQLQARATVLDDVITYFIYPKNVGGRMWDVKINMPIPQEATFISAEAPLPFVYTFDGREVSFSAIELERRATIDPLVIKITTPEAVDSPITTHAWATWKNVGKRVGITIPAQEEFTTGNLTVRPNISNQVMFDVSAGDVPFSNYDITSVTLQEVALPGDERALKTIFNTAEALGPVGHPLKYTLFIDADCRNDTGKREKQFGVEYSATYRHNSGYARFDVWNEQEKDWDKVSEIKASSLPGGYTVTMWVPYNLFENGQQFCWFAEANTKTKEFFTVPPGDKVPDDNELKLTHYEAIPVDSEVKAEELQAFAAKPGLSNGSDRIFINIGDTWQYLPGWSKPPLNWNTVNFDDSDWFSGATRIGYGDGKFATDLSRVTFPAQEGGTAILTRRADPQSGMLIAILPSGEDADSVYMRRVFTTDLALFTELALEVDYEGGFVAYLNGIEVVRRGLNASDEKISFDALASDDEPGISSEVIDLAAYTDSLGTGVNVLAIQAHRAEASSTLSMNPRLSWDFDPANISILDSETKKFFDLYFSE